MPEKQKLPLAVLLVAVTLGTAWAVRGQFGHTQGATWAGAFCALIIILLSGRADWLRNAFTITCACALGWGVGGIISYGLVVAYGQGLDFPNVYYGQTMLFFIGSLFGFLGGGLLGVSLGNTAQARVNWWSLAAQMLLGGVATHLILVQTLGLRMTPPRGDGWAACLGMALMLGWYMCRNHLLAAQRVALLGALGAGWGFAFGNFLRVAGISAGINFHHWNVMEYSIGFFGGGAVAYAVFTSCWPQKIAERTGGKISNRSRGGDRGNDQANNANATNAADCKTSEAPFTQTASNTATNANSANSRSYAHIAAVVLLTGFVPLVVWQQSFTAERLGQMLQAIGAAGAASAAGTAGTVAAATATTEAEASAWITLIQTAVLIAVIAAAALALKLYGSGRPHPCNTESNRNNNSSGDNTGTHGRSDSADAASADGGELNGKYNGEHRGGDNGSAGGDYRRIKRFFTAYMVAFIALSFLITGACFSIHRTEQYLYPLNLVFILLLVDRVRPAFTPRALNLRRWAATVLIALLALSALAYASIHMHGELWGAQTRFPSSAGMHAE